MFSTFHRIVFDYHYDCLMMNIINITALYLVTTIKYTVNKNSVQ